MFACAEFHKVLVDPFVQLDEVFLNGSPDLQCMNWSL